MTTVRTIRRSPAETETELRTGDLQLAIAALATIATGLSTPPFWAQFAHRAIKAFRSKAASDSRAFHLRMIHRTNLARIAEAAEERCARCAGQLTPEALPCDNWGGRICSRCEGGT